MPDDRDAETVLATIADEARAAWQAQINFQEWRADHFDAPFAELCRRYVEWVEAGEPYARSYRRIDISFPDYMDRLHALLLPIQLEMFGNE